MSSAVFLDHVCDVCANNALGIDGNAKLITRRCAHTDDGWMKSKALNASCAVGCTSRPIAGRLRYCRSLINEPRLINVFMQSFSAFRWVIVEVMWNDCEMIGATTINHNSICAGMDRR